MHEAPRGSVTLERIPDRGVKAAHPIAIEEGVIARALSGVRVTERKTALQTAFSKQSSMTRVFSEHPDSISNPLGRYGAHPSISVRPTAISEKYRRRLFVVLCGTR